jgi:hypothetical protein
VAVPKIDAVSDDLLVALRGFVPRDVACRMHGVPVDLFEGWLERGAAAKSGKYRVFLVAVEAAEAKAEATLILKMAAAARKGDVKAAQWLLERARPEAWARRSVSTRVVPAPVPGGARPPAPGEGEGEDWDLDNVRPIRRPGG